MIAYYDLARCPPTYDIVAFLCAIEQERIRRGDETIDIRIIPGPVGGFRDDKFWPHDIAGREMMLENVALPMARMLPRATVKRLPQRPLRADPNSVGYGGGNVWYGLARHVAAHRQGIRPLRVTGELPRAQRLVTITLREAEHWPERNSNFSEWMAAWKAITALGFDVHIIRDSLRATKGVDLADRARFYRSAVCNLFVNNGPAWFAMALDAPVLMFKPTVENLNRSCSAAYFADCGIPVGGQMPGSPDYQRIVWKEDSAAEIVAAFQDFMGVQNMRKAG